MKKILFTLFVIASIALQAQTNYYFSVTGSDTNDGLTPATAKKTLAEASTIVMGAGDSMLFKCGDTWRNERLLIFSEGTAVSHAVYSSYGTGAKPRFLGSRQGTTWTPHATVANVWQTSDLTDYQPNGASEVFLAKTGAVDNWGRDSLIWGDWVNGGNPTSLTYNYAWTAGNKTPIYLYWDGNPNTDFDYVEGPETVNCIQVYNKSYITINNIEIAFTYNQGIRENYPMRSSFGWTVSNCHIHHIGYKGSEVAYGIYCAVSDAKYLYNEMHDCGRRSLSLSLLEYSSFNTRMERVLIEGNHFHHGWHTTGLDMISATNDVVDSVVIRNNYFEGNPEVNIAGSINPENSNHIFISAKAAGIAGDTARTEHVYIYNNLFTYPHSKSISFEWIRNSYIVNNTFYGTNMTPTNDTRAISLSYFSHSNVIENNIFYNDDATGLKLTNLMICAAAYREGHLTINHNVHYGVSTNCNYLAFLNYTSDAFFTTPPEWIIYDWLHKFADLDDFHVSFPDIDSLSTFTDNPLFTDVANEDFSVQPGSPAIGMAVPYSFVSTDYLGNPRDPASPTAGAFEYADPDSTLAEIKVFTFAEATGSAVIDTLNNTVAIQVAYGTNLTSLNPTIVTSNYATYTPIGAQNFSSPVNYTLTSADGSNTSIYTITVTLNAALTGAAITGFTIAGQYSPTVLDEPSKTIAVVMPYNTDLSSLSPSILISNGASVLPATGTATDFSGGSVFYTVTAEDGVTSNVYEVRVIKNEPRLMIVAPKRYVIGSKVLFD